MKLNINNDIVPTYKYFRNKAVNVIPIPNSKSFVPQMHFGIFITDGMFNLLKH